MWILTSGLELTSENICKREQCPFPVGGCRKDEFQWKMSLALVGDRKGIQPQNLCTSYSSWNVLSLHCSSFTTVTSAVTQNVWRVKVANPGCLPSNQCVCDSVTLEAV